MTLARVAPGLLAILLLTPAASAQQSGARGFVSFNLAMQEGPQRLAVSVPVEIFGTSGTLDVDDHIIGGTMLDFGAGVRGRRFAFGGGYSRYEVKDSHELTASTIQFSPGSFQRVVNGTTPPLEHAEDTIYAFAGAARSVSEKFDVMVSGGPSFFRVTQAMPTGIDVTDPFGAILSIPVETVKKTAVGVHGALDLTYMLAPQFGVGGLVRYAWGSIDLPNGTKKMTVGGLNIGAGARLRF